MKEFSVILFTGGLIVCGLALGLIYLLVALLTFNLGGGETLSTIEAQRTAWLFFTLIVGLVAGNIARGRIRSGNISFAYGIRIMTLIVVIFVTINHFNNIIISTPFNKAAWDKYEYKPYRMAATLVKNRTLIGMTGQQVKDLLGEGGSFRYNVIGDWTLTLYFENGRVEGAEMRLPFLGI